MGGFSIWHILILAIILLLLFGGNRFSAMMGDVAKGLKSFKQGMADDEDEKRQRYDEQRRSEPPRLPARPGADRRDRRGPPSLSLRRRRRATTKPANLTSPERKGPACSASIPPSSRSSRSSR